MVVRLPLDCECAATLRRPIQIANAIRDDIPNGLSARPPTSGHAAAPSPPQPGGVNSPASFPLRCKGVRKVSVAERLVDGIGEMHRALVRVRLPRIFRLVLRNPRDSMCALALMTAVAAIVANSLYLQPGRHPAPIFAVRRCPCCRVKKSEQSIN